MILINLLPHREEARKQARREFYFSMVGFAVIGALLALAAYMWYQGRLETQNARNTLLQDQISQLDSQIAEVAQLENEIEALKTRQQAVEDLQADRNLPVHLLNETVERLPDGIFLRAIQQQGRSVTMSGSAQSNERVSQLLRNLSHNSQWISNPELVEILATEMEVAPGEKRRVYNFVIRLHLRSASEIKADEESAAAQQAGLTAASDERS